MTIALFGLALNCEQPFDGKYRPRRLARIG